MKEIDVGTVVGGKYALMRLLGAGAMGQVWVARHEALHQSFAVKLMLSASSSNDAAVQSHETAETSLKRFENEARIAAALSRRSRHIAQVTDYGIDDGAAYLVMEVLEGEGLEKRIGDGRFLAPAEVSALIAQVAKGLTVAHADGVMHRDLKPANVFLTQDDEGDLLVKLLDFGIARIGGHRLTIKGLVLGSPGYMSPEQAMAENPDARADVWSLAVVAYEALCGSTPFQAGDPDQTLFRICNFDATPLRDVLPTASEDLANVFVRAFSQKLEQRFQTATAFAEALAAVLPDPVRKLGQKTYAPTLRQRIRGEVPTEIDGGVSLKVPVRPRKVVSAIGVGIGVGLLVALFVVGLRSLLAPATDTRPAAAASTHPPASSLAEATASPQPAVSSEPVVLDVGALPKAVAVAPAPAKMPHVSSHPSQATASSSAPPKSGFDRSAIF